MVKITQLGPEPGATPEVPRNPRQQSPDAVFSGLLDAVRGLGNYMEAREAYDAKLRETRGELASEGGTDFIKRGQQFIERAKGLRKSVRDGVGLARGAGAAARPDTVNLDQFDQDADALERYHTDALEAEVFQQAVPDMRKRLRQQVKQAAADVVKAPSRRSEDDLRQATGRMIDEHRKAEVIDDVDVEQSRAEFEADIEDARIQDLAAADPQAALDLLKGGQAQFISPDRQEELYYDIAGNMEKAKAAKKADLTHAVDALQEGLRTGKVPAPEVLDSLNGLLADDADPVVIGAVKGVQKAMGTVARMGRMPLTKARATLDASLQKAQGPERDALASFGNGLLRDMQQSLSDDPLSFASERGVLDLEPLDFNATATEAFAARAKQARMIQAYYELDKITFLTAQERAGLGESFSKAEPEAKAQMMQQVAQAFGRDNGAALFREIDGVAPVEAHLATLAAHGGGREEMARRGFVGQKLLKEKGVTMPDEAALGAVEAEVIGSLFDARLSKTRGEVIATARALMAERMVTRGMQGFDDAAYRDALQGALGKGKDGGGPASWNGRKVLLPMDMDEAALREHMNGLTDEDLQRVSVSGRKPVHVSLSGKVLPATADEVRKGVLVQSGYGKYRVSMSNPDTGVAQYLADEQTGQYYEIDMGDPAKRPSRLVQDVVVGEQGDIGIEERRIAPTAAPKDQSRLVPGGNEPAPKKKKQITERLPEGG